MKTGTWILWWQVMRTAAAGGAVLALAGCSSRVSGDDIQKALADQLGRPSCFTDVEYRTFPVEPSTSMVGNDNPNFDALVKAGLASKMGKLYSLTPIGRAAYHPERNGFCYSAGYEIRKVLDVAPLPGVGDGSAVARAWTVTLSIVQKPIADWARDPAIAKRLIDQEALSTEPRTYHVILAHFRGEDGIKRNDPIVHAAFGLWLLRKALRPSWSPLSSGTSGGRGGVFADVSGRRTG